MAAVVLPYTLSFAPEDATATTSQAKLSAPTTQPLIPVGAAYAPYARIVQNGWSFEEADKVFEEERIQSRADSPGTNDADDGIGDEPESRELLERDPKDWKEQDHYAVLGLSHLRYKATPEQIKKAHRKKVLKHHPDKKAGSGDANDDSFFKCIAKAHEILSDPTKRRQFDSVDDAVDDDDVPEPDTEGDFFQLWGPVFEREARFSKTANPPLLGTYESTKTEVEAFYDFWYNFDSWRSFEYLDKEVNEGSDSRDEKRHQEKKNKADRARRKKEDIARVRTLVDRTLAIDPRIKKFRQEEKAARDAKKKTKESDDKAKKVEEAKAKEEELKKAKEEEAKKAAVEKASRETAKKAKEAAKKNLKKEKKKVREIVTNANYFAGPGVSPSPKTVENQLTELDLLLDSLEPEEVVDLRVKMEAALKEGESKVKATIVTAVAGSKADKASFKEFV